MLVVTLEFAEPLGYTQGVGQNLLKKHRKAPEIAYKHRILRVILLFVVFF